ncbi:MAG: HAMP domain-containing sensor histidine kinase [Actinomycetota bacterium]
MIAVTPLMFAADGPMMEEGPSLVLFAVLMAAISVVAVIALPPLLRRLPLRRSVPALALVGPLLAIVGGVIAAVAMALSGNDIWYALLVAAVTGLASTVVGLRIAGPVAKDLDRVAVTVESVAHGDRSPRTGIDRTDEIGRLASAVDELSRSLARAEVERAAADEERQSVVSALSHDLRTPLASLLVSVEALEDGIGDPEGHVRAMRGNVLALESLVGDLFLLARADAGSLALGREALDLSELVDEAIEAVGPVASARTVAVRSEIGDPRVVIGDHAALGRVLRNLLDNAVRHSPDGGVVRVVDRSAGATVAIEVVDDGPGFPNDFVPHALDRFSQADDARSHPGGAGLGLAIASTLLGAHDGSISVNPGPGGQVCIHLPADPADRSRPTRHEPGRGQPNQAGATQAT